MGFIWGFYFLASYLTKISNIDWLQKSFCILTLYGLAIFITWVAYHNDPIIEQAIKMPLRYWIYGIIPFIFYVVVMLISTNKGNSIFSKNILITILIATIWYGVFESYANYAVLTQTSKHIHLILRMKDDALIKTDSNLIYAGRTKNYWFLYNPKTHFVRSLKNDDIKIMDFDTYIK